MLKKINLQMLSVLSAVIIATVIICICAISCSGGKLDFKNTYYFVCYKMTDNAVSAGSISQSVSNYGGAGYILQRGENYYITFSCYYSDDEAKAVCENLKDRNMECSVLKVETGDYRLPVNTSQNNDQLYLGNLNTMHSLSSLAYECANGLDTGEFSQNKAKQILGSVTDTLNGLLKANPSNCFTESIQSVIEDCKRLGGGYLLSKNMRYIQISIVDKIINAKLN